MKTILLKLEDDFFWKLKNHKLSKEKDSGKNWKWEEYIKYLFTKVLIE
ncbi:hypothetical protein LCGC14_1236080 [marine sediment metagenome]|uniref:Uncharacterized protein n=1 Tax=marine sediment metagenome TaxID=412755 RepID=A0A0F9LBB5_9ZZZZ